MELQGLDYIIKGGRSLGLSRRMHNAQLQVQTRGHPPICKDPIAINIYTFLLFIHLELPIAKYID
jgi:hypothetical protein